MALARGQRPYVSCTVGRSPREAGVQGHVERRARQAPEAGDPGGRAPQKDRSSPASGSGTGSGDAGRRLTLSPVWAVPPLWSWLSHARHKHS